MALLLQALRDVRILSGDLDMLPPLAGGNPLGVGHLPSNFCEPALVVDLHGSPRFALSPFRFVTGSPCEPAEERR